MSYRITRKDVPWASYPTCQKAVSASLIESLQWHKAGGVWLGPYNSASTLGGNVYFDTRRDASMLQTEIWYRTMAVCNEIKDLQRDYVTPHSYEPLALLKTLNTDVAMQMVTKEIKLADKLGCIYNFEDYRPDALLPSLWDTRFFTTDWEIHRRVDETQLDLINTIGALDNPDYIDVSLHGVYAGNFGPIGRTNAWSRVNGKWAKVAETEGYPIRDSNG